MGVDPLDKATWGTKDLNVMTSEALFNHYGLEENTIDFIGHAVAL